MPLPPSPAPPAFSRRTLLTATAAGLGVLLVGCTSDDDTAAVTPRQADQLTDQVTVQEGVVAAFAAAGAADPDLGTQVAGLAAQAQQQLDRLRAAVPSPTSPAASSAASSGAGPTGDPRSWLRAQVAGAADSHATACLDQTGARAALLGSIAAGLRGQDGRLA